MGPGFRRGAEYRDSAITKRGSGARGGGGADRRAPEIDDRLVEAPQGAVMADADDRRMPIGFAQQPVERGFGGLVERRGRFVEENDLRAHEQDARKAKPLLLAAGEALRPIAVDIELVDQISEPDSAQRRFELGAARLMIGLGIGDRIAQRAERQIRPLRQEQRMPVADPNPAAAERPEPGDRAQQGALAGARGAGDEAIGRAAW